MVTPEIVAQMGFVPRGLYEKKLTVGQQRRPKAKKHAQRGGTGSINSWNENYTLIAVRLQQSQITAVNDFDRLIRSGRITNTDGPVVTAKGAKRKINFTEVEPQPESASDS